MMFSFAHPNYLFLLIAIPLLVFIHFFALNHKRRVALKFANFDAIARIQGVDFFSKNIVDLSLGIFIVLLMILSVSGLTLHIINEASAFSFVIAIDTSQSMSADDFSPDRLTVAKETASEFVRSALFGTRLGVISFAGSTLIEQDLSLDRDLVIKSISDIELGSFGGTDLYEATVTSGNMLQNEDHKAIVLLSDGQINVGTINSTIEYASFNDIMIHSIAMGTVGGGQAGYGLSKLDEDALKAVSYNTWGQYFQVDDRETLEKSFRKILGLTIKRVSIDLAGYLTVFAIILFVIRFFLVNTKYFNFL